MIGHLLLLLAQVAQSQPPTLVPRVLLPGEGVGSSFWLTAPYIGVIAVRSTDWIGDPVEITPPGELVVRLVRVDAEVESVVKGELQKGPLQFYFFVNVPSANGYNTYLSWFEPGRRYVAFLRRDGENFRTMTDLVTMNIRIRSGRHSEDLAIQSEPVGTNPGFEIAYATLTPSADYEPGFAENIDNALEEAQEFSSPGQAFKMMRKLLVHPDDSIREHACMSLMSTYGYLDPCLLKLVDSKDAAIRAQAERNMHYAANTSIRPVLAVLKNDPSSLSRSGRVEDLADSLEVFTFDLDSRVRSQACESLRRLFPSRQYANCAGSGDKKR